MNSNGYKGYTPTGNKSQIKSKVDAPLPVYPKY